MKRKLWITIPIMIFLFCSLAAAQNVVKDGGFPSESWLFWSKTGGHYGGAFVVYAADGTHNSICYSKKPNTTNGNGSIVQQVELIQNIPYEFSAKIAANKPC